jgi:hypothetical protein
VAEIEVHRILLRLQAEVMVRLKSGTLTIRITICNYEDYQLKPSASGTVAAHSRDELNTDSSSALLREGG